MFYYKLLFSFFLLFSFNCSPTEPVVNDNEKLQLSVEEVSSTEAWLKLSSAGLNTGSAVELKQDGVLIATIIDIANDTIIFIDSLLPNKAYSFQATGADLKSNKVTAATLDTTSHNISWETFEFGDYGSRLSDVAIIDENNIWGVGEIYLDDPSGKPDPILYNAVHWNGTEWELKQIQVYYKGITIAPLNGVFALPSKEIILSSGLPYLPDPDGWTVYHLWEMGVFDQEDGSVKNIWGTSINQLYFAGDKGSIVYYNGKTWQKIESGTTSHITDIWGIKKDTETSIFCTVSSFFEPGEKKILKITDNQVESIPWDNGYYLSGIWTNNNNFLYICGDAVFENKRGYWEKINLPSISMNEIRGTALNDIMLVGDFGTIAHFNGLTWQIYYTSYDTALYSLSMKNNLTVIAGEKNGKGIITLGQRQ